MNKKALYIYLKYLFYLKLLLEINYENTLYYEKYLNKLVIFSLKNNINLEGLETLNKSESLTTINYLIKKIIKSL